MSSDMRRELLWVKNELEMLRRHHDGMIHEAYRILGIDGSDGEFRSKWVLLEASKVVKQRDELLESLKNARRQLSNYTTNCIGGRDYSVIDEIADIDSIIAKLEGVPK